MQTQIQWHGLKSSEALMGKIEAQSEGLSALWPYLRRVRAVVDHQPHHPRFEVKVELDVLGRRLVTSREDRDVYKATTAAFEAMSRQLETTIARRQRQGRPSKR